jgi:hypothetical protein
MEFSGDVEGRGLGADEIGNIPRFPMGSCSRQSRAPVRLHPQNLDTNTNRHFPSSIVCLIEIDLLYDYLNFGIQTPFDTANAAAKVCVRSRFADNYDR